jgi:hypothetical protein
MSSALDRLAEIVRLAESKTRAQKLGAEAHQAAERLRNAEERARKAEQQLQEVRPAGQRDLEQAEADEIRLKQLMKALAQSLATLEVDQQQQAEREIATAQVEIAAKKKEATDALEAVHKESDAARRELRAAREQYQQLRREMDQVTPHLAGDFAADDRLVRDAELFLPTGQIQSLAREVDDGERHFGMLSQKEQFYQLKIWIGRFRRLQSWAESDAHDALELTDAEHAQLREIFPRLVGISKQYMPGYIEAFSRAFETNWDMYVSDAEEQLKLALDTARRDRETDLRRREVQAREIERQKLARQSGEAALDELKGVIARCQLPDEGVEEFQAALTRVVSSLGTSDPHLLELVRPFADLLNGKDFRAMRRNLERVDPDEARRQENDSLREQFQDLITATRGRRAVMIGGAVREEARRSLLQVFDFDDLEWQPYESARPVMLKSLEQRVRNRGLDLLLILKEFVGHHVSDSLRPLCEEYGIPCLLVEHGYGAAQVADALRRVSAKLVSGEAAAGR